MDNQTIAQKLLEHASWLESQESDLFRVRAYRHAAGVVQAQPRPLADLFAEGGRPALEALPGIGSHLAYALEGLLTTGQLRTLHPEGSSTETDRQLTSVPGIGPRLAQQIRERLGIHTREELVQAAEAGRLPETGLGPRRLRALMACLLCEGEAKSMLKEPSVRDLLAIDAEFRASPSATGDPLWAAPFRRERAGWRYRVRYSRTALAYRQGQAGDWIEIHYENNQHSGQRLVVTEVRGDLHGRRVVRGRERECRRMYQQEASA